MSTDIALHVQLDPCAFDFTNQQKVRKHTEPSITCSVHNC
jgi:hypothetical protein